MVDSRRANCITITKRRQKRRPALLHTSHSPFLVEQSQRHHNPHRTLSHQYPQGEDAPESKPKRHLKTNLMTQSCHSSPSLEAASTQEWPQRQLAVRVPTPNIRSAESWIFQDSITPNPQVPAHRVSKLLIPLHPQIWTGLNRPTSIERGDQNAGPLSLSLSLSLSYGEFPDLLYSYHLQTLI